MLPRYNAKKRREARGEILFIVASSDEREWHYVAKEESQYNLVYCQILQKNTQAFRSYFRAASLFLSVWRVRGNHWLPWQDGEELDTLSGRIWLMQIEYPACF